MLVEMSFVPQVLVERRDQLEKSYQDPASVIPKPDEWCLEHIFFTLADCLSLSLDCFQGRISDSS